MELKDQRISRLAPGGQGGQGPIPETMRAAGRSGLRRVPETPLDIADEVRP